MKKYYILKYGVNSVLANVNVPCFYESGTTYANFDTKEALEKYIDDYKAGEIERFGRVVTTFDYWECEE
jgi:hypothetical protein